jgi:hypothetical protein
MRYRRFGALDWQVSCLGFGCMRLPTTDGLPMSPHIKEREAVHMIRHAIDAGVNYVDTAYPYHGGASEVVLGKALRDGYRDKVRLATKSPLWSIAQPADFDKYLAEQLARLQTDHIDFYLLHGLDKARWENTVLKLGLLERAEAAIRDGRIRWLGFSFHDEAASFRLIVDGYDHWTLCLVQYNYLDVANQAGTKGVRYAAAKGLAVAVMEPLLGGKLARQPRRIREILERRAPGRSPADLALQWVWDQPEVSVVLSGMNTLAQVEANLASAEQSAVGSLTAADHALIAELRAAYLADNPIPCTKCGYCLPCPNGVAIVRNFELYNDGFIHEDVGVSRGVYSRFLTEAQRAGACTACRTCEDLCPQKIAVSDWMKKVHAVLGEEKAY